jgi:hypothetical protein
MFNLLLHVSGLFRFFGHHIRLFQFEPSSVFDSRICYREAIVQFLFEYREVFQLMMFYLVSILLFQFVILNPRSVRKCLFQNSEIFQSIMFWFVTILPRHLEVSSLPNQQMILNPVSILLFQFEPSLVF